MVSIAVTFMMGDYYHRAVSYATHASMANTGISTFQMHEYLESVHLYILDVQYPIVRSFLFILLNISF